MNFRLCVALLFVSVPVCGQSRVYTNADLGQPIQRTRTVTLEELASLRANQFVAPPQIPDGPSVLILGSNATDGPFGPLHLSPIEPLDRSWRFRTPIGRGYGAAFGIFPSGPFSRDSRVSEPIHSRPNRRSSVDATTTPRHPHGRGAAIDAEPKRSHARKQG